MINDKFDSNDPEQKFIKDLNKRQKSNMHLKFFELNGDVDYIRIPIFSKYGPRTKIVPYRNTECTKPGCVYDITDLVSKFKNAMMSSYLQFVCYSCKRFIEIKNFYIDLTLNKMIEEIWEKYNKEDKIICEHVTIFKTGHWEPELPEYIKLLQKNMNKMMNSKDSIRKVKGADEEILQKVKHEEKLPSLNEYTASDYKEKLDAFKEEKVKPDQIILARDGISITRTDLLNVDNDVAVSPRIVCMFLNYIRTLQQREKDKYNKYNKNRYYVNAINIVKWEPYMKKVKYEYFCGFINDYKKNVSLIPDHYDKIAILFKIDERWIGLIVEIALKRFHIIDFLQDDLSRINIDHILDCFVYIMNGEYGIKHETNIFYNSYKVNFYTDCGLYVLNYLYKSINNDVIENLRIRYNEKEIFRKQLIWLLLSFRELKSKLVDIYAFPPSSSKSQKLFKDDSFKLYPLENDEPFSSSSPGLNYQKLGDLSGMTQNMNKDQSRFMTNKDNTVMLLRRLEDIPQDISKDIRVTPNTLNGYGSRRSLMNSKSVNDMRRPDNERMMMNMGGNDGNKRSSVVGSSANLVPNRRSLVKGQRQASGQGESNIDNSLLRLIDSVDNPNKKPLKGLENTTKHNNNGVVGTSHSNSIGNSNSVNGDGAGGLKSHNKVLNESYIEIERNDLVNAIKVFKNQVVKELRAKRMKEIKEEQNDNDDDEEEDDEEDDEEDNEEEEDEEDDEDEEDETQQPMMNIPYNNYGYGMGYGMPMMMGYDPYMMGGGGGGGSGSGMYYQGYDQSGREDQMESMMSNRNMGKNKRNVSINNTEPNDSNIFDYKNKARKKKKNTGEGKGN